MARSEAQSPEVATPVDIANRPRVSRRDVLIAVGGAVVGVGVLGAGVGVAGRISDSGDAASAAPGEAADTTPGIRRFTSTTLTAPKMTPWTKEGAVATAGYLFASPRTTANNGVIYQNDGEPVWIEPDGQNVMDLRVQEYRGEPVLTYWEGTILDGWGTGVGTIMDTSYRKIATVRAGNGITVDLHEFVLTSRGTALFIAYPVERHDLSSIGGPENGWVLGGRVQEIDIASGAVLLDWNVFDHVDVSETYQKLGSDGTSPGTAFDPVHLNSIEEDGDTLLLSGRHTHALYSVDRETGAIGWRLGGRKSDFEVDEDAAFNNQHDARRRSDGRISLFDNHGQVGADAVSAGLLLDVDENAHTVKLNSRFSHRKHFGGAMGSMQLLDNGNFLVGWGTDPTATEFTPDGTAIFEARDLGSASYRVFRHEWQARPTTVPDAAFRVVDDETVRVYASWNGATEVQSWRVLSGTGPNDLAEAATAVRDGFETSVEVPAATLIVVEALDVTGSVLASSTARAV